MNHRFHPSRHPAGPVTSMTAIAVCVGICLGTLAFLIPNRDQLFERLITDGKSDSAAKLVTGADRADHSAVITALTAETVQLCRDNQWNQQSVEVLGNFLRTTGDLEPITAEILRQSPSIPPAPRVAILGILVQRALRNGDVALAETMQLQLLDATESLTPDLVRQAVTTFRYNNNPALALETIERFETQGGPIPTDLYETRITLARETSQPDIAFQLLKRKIDETNDPASLRQLIPTAIKTGIEAGQQATLVPLYLRYLEVAGDRKDDPLVPLYSFRLAQTYEWTNQPSKAFDCYLELARLGHRISLDRCRLLTKGLFRDADLLSALLDGKRFYESDDELLLLTATLLADAARHDEAIATYTAFLKRHPEHADSHYRLGLVHDEANHFDEAFQQFQQALALAPDRPEFLHAAGRMANILGNYEVALPLFRKLSHATRDLEHAEKYHVLATGLGSREALKDSLRLLIELDSSDTPEYYNYLANTHREEGRIDLAAKVLSAGVKATPDDSPLVLALADAQLDLKQPQAALETLSLLSFDRHPTVAPRILSGLQSLSAQPATQRRFLSQFGTTLDQHIPATDLVALAELHQRVGNLARARGLYQKATGLSKDHGQLALAWFQLGEPETARKFQLSHIRNSNRPASTDYQFLGDILARLEQSGEAKTAYLQALSILNTETARR